MGPEKPQAPTGYSLPLPGVLSHIRFRSNFYDILRLIIAFLSLLSRGWVDNQVDFFYVLKEKVEKWRQL